MDASRGSLDDDFAIWIRAELVVDASLEVFERILQDVTGTGVLLARARETFTACRADVNEVTWDRTRSAGKELAGCSGFTADEVTANIPSGGVVDVGAVETMGDGDGVLFEFFMVCREEIFGEEGCEILNRED